MNSDSLKERVDLLIKEHEEDPFRREIELKKLLKQAEKSSNVYCIGFINFHLAFCIFQQGKRGSMLPHSYKAVKIFEKMNDKTALARSYNLMGIAYAGEENFQAALFSYFKALDLIRGKRMAGIRKETLLNNIGDSYYQMGAYQKSLSISLKCLSGCKKNNPENHRSIVLYGLNTADNYCCLNEFQQAKQTLQSIAESANQLQKCSLLSAYYARCAWVSYATGDAETGARNADQCLEMIASKYDSYEFHEALEQIVLFQIKRNDFNRARHISDVLTQYAEESMHTTDLLAAKRVQASLCMAGGERDQALTLYREINDLYREWIKEQREMQYESQKRITAAAKDITKLMDTIRASEEKAERDPLTGLMNRSALVRITNQFIQTAKGKGKKLGGIFLDIDYFKQFNDTYGHAAGDDAIRKLARICMDEETPAVQFFRYGGDEVFGVVLGYSENELKMLAHRIAENVRALELEHEKNPNGQRLTVSVGLVNLSLKEAEYTLLDVINGADRALYYAKENGKNTVFSLCDLPASKDDSAEQ